MNKQPNDQLEPKRISEHGGACRNRTLLRIARSIALAAEPPLETKRIRLVQVPSICHGAPVRS